MIGRRRQRAVPERLRVVVRVHVDEAGRHDLAGGVDRLSRLLIDTALFDTADRDDPPVADTDVGVAGLASGSVDDGSTSNDDVQHVIASLRACP